MRIIIAPAKKMVVDTDSFAVDSLPQFLEQTERLKVSEANCWARRSPQN